MNYYTSRKVPPRPRISAEMNGPYQRLLVSIFKFVPSPYVNTHVRNTLLILKKNPILPYLFDSSRRGRDLRGGCDPWASPAPKTILHSSATSNKMTAAEEAKSWRISLGSFDLSEDCQRTVIAVSCFGDVLPLKTSPKHSCGSFLFRYLRWRLILYLHKWTNDMRISISRNVYDARWKVVKIFNKLHFHYFQSKHNINCKFIDEINEIWRFFL